MGFQANFYFHFLNLTRFFSTIRIDLFSSLYMPNKSLPTLSERRSSKTVETLYPLPFKSSFSLTGTFSSSLKCILIENFFLCYNCSIPYSGFYILFYQSRIFL